MGLEQSSLQQSDKSKGPLSAFCCNTNLCNNDSNIDNRMTEINRKNAHRTMLAVDQRSRGGVSSNGIYSFNDGSKMESIRDEN